jgi:hypothetical protein
MTAAAGRARATEPETNADRPRRRPFRSGAGSKPAAASRVHTASGRRRDDRADFARQPHAKAVVAWESRHTASPIAILTPVVRQVPQTVTGCFGRWRSRPVTPEMHSMEWRGLHRGDAFDEARPMQWAAVAVDYVGAARRRSLGAPARGTPELLRVTSRSESFGWRRRRWVARNRARSLRECRAGSSRLRFPACRGRPLQGPRSCPS